MKRFSQYSSSFLKKAIKKLDILFIILYNGVVKKQKRVPK